jgi:hypothetical protein
MGAIAHPVRLAGLGLGKGERAAARLGAIRAPGANLIALRLVQQLRANARVQPALRKLGHRLTTFPSEQSPG